MLLGSLAGCAKKADDAKSKVDSGVSAVVSGGRETVSDIGEGITKAVSGVVSEADRMYDNGQVRILLPVSEADYVEGNGFDFINSFGIKDVAVWGGLNCLAATVLLAILAVLFNIIRKVFVEIKESDTPFTESIQKRLKITAILVTIMTIFESIGLAVIVALSFWCVYCIFGYGIELQKNEDETL